MRTLFAQQMLRLLVAMSMLALVTSGWAVGVAAQSPSPGVVEGTFVVDGAWARPSPMVSRAGAAYMVITNAGSADDALVGASTEAAAFVELHETSAREDGTMAMMPVESIPLPAGGSAVLEPGGLHLMLIDLVAPLEPGAMLDLTLAFESGASLTVPVEVGMPTPMPSGCPMQPMEPGVTPPPGCPTPMAPMDPEGGMPTPSPDPSPIPA
jgi:periplasmic copper chaperone A